MSDDSCWFTVAAGNGRAAESESVVSVAMSSHEKQEGERYTCAIQNASYLHCLLGYDNAFLMLIVFHL